MWGIWDEPFFQFFADEMNKMQEPFMTSIFSLSSHHPFKVPEQYTDVFPKGTLPLHQCVGYTDNALKNFFNAAKEMPWYNNTMFVITADHSSRGQYDHSFISTNKFQIPLILFSPGDDNMVGVDTRLAQQIDIMPTVLNYIGFDKTPYVAFGNNLLDEESKRFAINYINSSYQLLQDNYVIHFDGQNIIGAYDTTNDPMLKKNIKDVDNTYQKHLPLMKGIIQQYNNRMIEDRLTIKK
jgi:phosphoglycerol transferase MdoB-like AlkP superfamily enzyme